MIVSVISDGYPKLVRNPMGMDINFYPRVRSRADIDCNRGYGCGQIFAISNPNPIRFHPYLAVFSQRQLNSEQQRSR